MTKSTGVRIPYIRWVQDEWLAVVREYLAIKRPDLSDKVVLLKAQRVLPKQRQKDESAFGWNSIHVPLSNAIAAFNKLTPEQQAAITVPSVITFRAADVMAQRAKKARDRRAATASKTPIAAAVETVAKPKHPHESLGAQAAKADGSREIRWIEKDWAELARAVRIIRKRTPLMDVFEAIFIAQDYALPPHRRVPASQWKARTDSRTGQRNIRLSISAGYQAAELLDPNTLHPELREVATEAQAPAQAPQEPSAPPQPLSVGSAPVLSLAAAGREFADTISGAVDRLLKAHERIVEDAIAQRLNQLGPQLGAQVAAMIETGMQKAVHRMLEHELGGNVAPPAIAAGPSAPIELPVDALSPVGLAQLADRPQRLRVDIVGVIGPNISRIKDAFNGNLDARYVDVDQLSKWVPSRDRHCIVMTKFINHQVENRLRAYKGPKPIRINGGPQLVINAIEQLMIQEGITIGAH